MKHYSQTSLIVLLGPPGCGKSTLAKYIIKSISVDYVETDSIWRELYTTPKYDQDESWAVYNKILDIVKSYLTTYSDIILEGVFASSSRIKRLIQIAEQYDANIILIGVRCDYETAMTRMISRKHNFVPKKMWQSLYRRQQDWCKNYPITWIDSASMNCDQCGREALRIISQNRATC